ncbi:unnamed protein product [Linum trigynum]|uniref:Uncharacterized protein n=1 Tax=Linum trigynum TaxID=586398 RepID=A0AAV2E799_9ROSI
MPAACLSTQKAIICTIIERSCFSSCLCLEEEPIIRTFEARFRSKWRSLLLIAGCLSKQEHYCLADIIGTIIVRGYFSSTMPTACLSKQEPQFTSTRRPFRVLKQAGGDHYCLSQSTKEVASRHCHSRLFGQAYRHCPSLL